MATGRNRSTARRAAVCLAAWAAIAGCSSSAAKSPGGSGSLVPLPPAQTDAGSIAPDADVWVTDAAVVACTFSAQLALSPPIPTVGIVTWSTTLPEVSHAEIHFGRATVGADEYVAPVDLTLPNYRTLLLGMKGSTTYLVRIIASNSQGSCASPDYTITTGPVPASVPAQSVAIDRSAPRARGFIVTSSGLKGNSAFILDTDGAIVWWAMAPAMPSRVHMSWDGRQMYMMSLNVQNQYIGEIEVVGMDGTAAISLEGFASSHHDLTPTPDGFATLDWNKPGVDAPCSLVEWNRSNGQVTTVVADLGTLYNASTFHPNALHYYPADDTYVIGDRNPSLFVKLSRAGSLVWQFGGSNPKDPSKFFTGVPAWSVNHGHQLLPDGTFLFFNNTPNEAWQYALDTTQMTATATWHYSAAGATSVVLGDVQRLPNGNNLVTFSTSGQIHEVDPTGKLVARYTSGSYGYTEFRESLYGPPPY